MIKILINGTEAKYKKIMQFECKRCGCIFEADEYDYVVTYGQFDERVYHSQCPYCHQESVKVGPEK